MHSFSKFVATSQSFAGLRCMKMMDCLQSLFTNLIYISRVVHYLNQAVYNYVNAGDWAKDQVRECYLSLVDVPPSHKLRELSMVRIGTLIRISGQVVTIHPVHPKLIIGTFCCLDCNAVINNVEQQSMVN